MVVVVAVGSPLKFGPVESTEHSKVTQKTKICKSIVRKLIPAIYNTLSLKMYKSTIIRVAVFFLGKFCQTAAQFVKFSGITASVKIIGEELSQL